MNWKVIYTFFYAIFVSVLWVCVSCEEQNCNNLETTVNECNTQTRASIFSLMDGESNASGKQSRSPDSTSIPQSMALVLYDESTLSPFHKDLRKFDFSGKEVVIKQNWRDLGLAAVVWDAAVVLGEYLDLNQSLVTGKRIIELGAGTGLTGIVAGLLGGDVTITDRKIALEQIQDNVKENFNELALHSVKVQELDWGHDLDSYQGHYDLILGADIIYIEETFSDLLETLLHLADCKTLVLIACKIRYERDSRFLNLMKEHFTVDKVHYDEQRDIYVYANKKNC